MYCASMFNPNRRFRLPHRGLLEITKLVKGVTITLPGDLSWKWRGLWVNEGSGWRGLAGWHIFCSCGVNPHRIIEDMHYVLPLLLFSLFFDDTVTFY